GQNVPVGPQTVALPKDGPADFRHQFPGANPARLDLDDLPEFREPAPVAVALPAMLNGRVAAAGEADVWPVELKKDGNYVFELRARRLGSPLAGVLTLTDPAGKELARADAVAEGAADPVLRFRAPADGVYRLTVADRFRSRGGPAFAYRLR